MNPRPTTGQRILRAFVMVAFTVILTVVLVALLSTYA